MDATSLERNHCFLEGGMELILKGFVE